MTWSPYDLDPNCSHEQLIDTLPPVDHGEHFRRTGEVLMRLRQWECVACGGSHRMLIHGEYDVDLKNGTATKRPPRYFTPKASRQRPHVQRS